MARRNPWHAVLHTSEERMPHTRTVAHWLLKTEQSAYSIQDLERDGTTLWDGVRNYWARNFMQTMKVGDKAIVYHTNAKPSGAAGLARIAGKARPDPTAFDRKD